MTLHNTMLCIAFAIMLVSSAALTVAAADDRVADKNYLDTAEESGMLDWSEEGSITVSGIMDRKFIGIEKMAGTDGMLHEEMNQ